MDWQIRIALIVGGILLVVFVIYDYNKKRKIEQENEKLKKRFSKNNNQLDSAGFDIDGVGQVRSVKAVTNDELTNSDGIEDVHLVESEANDYDALQHSSEDKPSVNIPDFNQAKVQNELEPKINEALVEGSHNKPRNSVESETKTSKPKTDLFEPDEEESIDEPELILSLILKCETGKEFAGKDFLPIFLSQGLRHGDMGIFHRYNKNGKQLGQLLFSLANGIAPGTFDIANIQQFSTPVFALFVTLPGPADPQVAYDAMYKTIKLLKEELGGHIFDETQSKYTEQTHNHRLDQIQEFNRKRS